MTIEQPVVDELVDIDAELDAELATGEVDDPCSSKCKCTKHKKKFYFFCPTLKGTVHGDTCAKNKAIKKSAWSARVCQDCKGMPKGTKKISEAEYHVQVAEEMKKAAELNQQTNSRVPYIAKGYIDTQRISMARDNRGSK